MTVHISRDFPATPTGYQSGGGLNMAFTPYLYCLAIFMRRILGFSIVGSTGFDLDGYNNQSSTVSQGTAIAVGSNGQSLPQSTINVASTAGFPASGQMWVETSNGYQIVWYSGTTGTAFTNCYGGTGTMTAGQSTTTTAVQSLPTAIINVTSTTGFAASGTIYVITTNGPQTVTYTGTTATSFTGCSGGTGSTSIGGAVTSAGNTVVCGTNRIVSASTSVSAGWTINTSLPHGMTDGQYTHLSGLGAISTGIAFSPFKVKVLSPTQLKLVGTSSSGLYTANSMALIPTGMLVASGTNASINFAGAPSTSAVQVPTTNRTVVTGTATNGDVGRILVLKSKLYPTKNSGLFKITAVNTATNSYTIDYRSTDTPPPESGMDWWIYENEVQVGYYLLQQDGTRANVAVTNATNTTPIQITCNVNTVSHYADGQKFTVTGVGGNTAANGTWYVTAVNSNTLILNGSSGNGTFTSNGSIARAEYGAGVGSFNSKIILQSPHSTGWQVRLSVDPYNAGGIAPYSSITMGYNGSALGDFSPGGITTNIAQYLDSDISNSGPYQYSITGSAYIGGAPRITMVGDDSGKSLYAYTRTQTAASNGQTILGIPDNEPTPLPPNSNRFFVYAGASAVGNDYGGIKMRGGNGWNVGVTYRDTAPELCMIGGLTYADGTNGTPGYNASAGDNPFTSSTELFPWEIWAGVLNETNLALPFGSFGQPIYWTFNQRFMGTAPFVRQGRTNFGDFTLVTDSTATSSISAATNTAPIQITTSAANALVTGQTVIITGATGNTAANGTWVITVIDSTHFTLTGSVGNGTYTGSGSVQGTARWLHLQNGIYLQWNGAGGLNA